MTVNEIWNSARCALAMELIVMELWVLYLIDIKCYRHYLYIMCWSLNSLRPSDPYMYVSELTIIGSDNGLSPGRRQTIIWTNAIIL